MSLCVTSFSASAELVETIHHTELQQVIDINNADTPARDPHHDRNQILLPSDSWLELFVNASRADLQPQLFERANTFVTLLGCITFVCEWLIQACELLKSCSHDYITSIYVICAIGIICFALVFIGYERINKFKPIGWFTKICFQLYFLFDKGYEGWQWVVLMWTVMRLICCFWQLYNPANEQEMMQPQYLIRQLCTVTFWVDISEPLKLCLEIAKSSLVIYILEQI